MSLDKSIGYTALPKLALYIHFKRCKLYHGFVLFFKEKASYPPTEIQPLPRPHRSVHGALSWRFQRAHRQQTRPSGNRDPFGTSKLMTMAAPGLQVRSTSGRWTAWAAAWVAANCAPSQSSYQSSAGSCVQVSEFCCPLKLTLAWSSL